ncbi:glucose dehydrogenase [FAD, quinone]-like [Frankliniella occidentalis]|uniref:Glucose dehydrogenase [FAD, quinone]-like n=1 Tax=Frankliniella occidentalis TaxID=133901 RepID=A0A6J1SI25_FRAOC|nr:glucose dehydrogenase [FAD, quinone]-like [Frankliniella occidentalis]
MERACPVAQSPACTPASLFTTLLLSSLRHDGERQRDDVKDSPDAPKDFDFIVVGGGSAGCVVASRLSENPAWRVLLLEAGPEEPALTEVPAFNRLFLHTDVDWQFRTQASGWDPGQYVPRGRTLGGSSAINGMLYSRGHPEDYDSWERMGNPGWAYRDVLPFFKKSENNHDEVDADLHGRGGPLDVSHFPYRDENVPVVLEAMEQAGLPFNADHTGREQSGATLLQFTQRDGHRRSSNQAFIAPVRRKRPNLVVRPLSPVRRVLLDSNKRAVGVEYDGPHGPRVALARREVIVSAGALQSPQILMLSGIGPREHLEEAGIAPIHDLPAVGQNLKDHLTTMLTVNFTVTKTATERSDTLQQRLAAYARYLDGGHGPLSATGVRQVAAFFRTKQQDGTSGRRPLIHLEVIGQLMKRRGAAANCTAPGEDSVWYDQIRISPVLLHPRYSGQVRLNTTSPRSLPLLYLNISLDEDEERTWVEGFRVAASLNDTASFREAGIVLDAPPLPGCTAAPNSDAYWGCAGRRGAQTWGHLTGTCRMGPDAAASVVDAQLHVHGVDGLRVVDASVMPDLPSGNTNGPSIMVGEKGAELIRQAHWDNGMWTDATPRPQGHGSIIAFCPASCRTRG